MISDNIPPFIFTREGRTSLSQHNPPSIQQTDLPESLEMSLMEKFEMEEANLPFKIFVPRSSSRFRSESSVSSSSTSKLNLTVGSPLVSSSSSPQQLFSPDGGEAGGEGDGEASSRCFDFTGLRRLAPRPLPSELLLASSSPSSSTRLMSSDLFQLRPDSAGFSGDPNLPKRLHVSNIPFRYR